MRLRLRLRLFAICCLAVACGLFLLRSLLTAAKTALDGRAGSAFASKSFAMRRTHWLRECPAGWVEQDHFKGGAERPCVRASWEESSKRASSWLSECPANYVFDAASSMCVCPVPRQDNSQCDEVVLPRCAYPSQLALTCDYAAFGVELRTAQDAAKVGLFGSCDCLMACMYFLEQHHAFATLFSTTPRRAHRCLAPPWLGPDEATNAAAWQATPQLERWRASLFAAPNASAAAGTRVLLVRRGADNLPYFTAPTALPPIALAPLADCPAGCSGHGMCLQRDKQATPACVCAAMYDNTRACAFRRDVMGNGRQTFCLHDCWQRGHCVGSACLCFAGFGGIDCALHWNNATRAYELAAAARLTTTGTPVGGASCVRGTGCIFVLELGGPFALSWEIRDKRGMSIDFGRATPITFAAQVLASPRRVAAAAQADYIFIASAGACFASRLDVLAAVRARWPDLWGRAGGADMIWLPLVDDDGQGVYWGPAATHWTRVLAAVPTEPETTVRLTCMGLIRGASCHDTVGSFVRGRDIVLPPQPKQAFLRALAKNSAYRRNWRERATLLFFSGTIARSWVKGNVRLAAMDAAAAWADSRVRIVDGMVKDDAAEMANSVFCLAPPGKLGHWGFRSSMAVLSGCVPVIIGDNRALEFEELLGGADAYDPAIVIREAHIHSVHDILVRMMANATDMDRRQSALWHVLRPLFDWEQGSTRVLDAVIAILNGRRNGSELFDGHSVQARDVSH